VNFHWHNTWKRVVFAPAGVQVPPVVQADSCLWPVGGGRGLWPVMVTVGGDRGWCL
jgi:hypothetical protein